MVAGAVASTAWAALAVAAEGELVAEDGLVVLVVGAGPDFRRVVAPSIL